MKNLFIHAQGRPAQSRAFTIIELMVVVAIMAILTGIVMTSLTGSKAKARDAKRISDLAQIQSALGSYFEMCDEYPRVASSYLQYSGVDIGASNGFGTDTGCYDSKGVKLSTFLPVIPTEPSGGVYHYGVSASDISVLHPRDYVLHTTLESSNNVLKDSLSPLPAHIQFIYQTSPKPPIICNNIKEYCIGPK